MSVDPAKFIRTTPLGTLRKYLVQLAPEMFGPINWKAPRQELTPQLLEASSRLPRASNDQLLCDLDRAGQFEGEAGRRILRAVLPDVPAVLEQFDALEDVSACALQILMQGGDAFENALAALFAQRLLNGRDWTGFTFQAGPDLALRPNASLEHFAEKLRDIFSDGTSRRALAVEGFTRRDPDPAGSGTLVRRQFTIYVEGPPEAMLTFDGADFPHPQTVRPVREAAILFDARERLLDVVAKGGGNARRQQIADAFVAVMLSPGAKLATRSRRTLALDLLKHRPRFECRTEDRVRHVDVARLVMGAPDHGAIAAFEVPAKGRAREADDIYARAERAFGPNGLPGRSGWTIRSAKLRITFEPEKRAARAKTVTFEMKAPDRTNLRDQIELHRRIADTLLSRWGLYAPEEPDATARPQLPARQ